MSEKLKAWLRFAALTTVAIAAIVPALISLTAAYDATHFNQEQANKAATEDARRASDQAQRHCKLIARSEQPNCRETIDDRKREQQRREYEVEAQQNSAVWDEAMGEAALIGAMFTVLSLLLIYFAYRAQIDANERGRKEALEAARAADERLAHQKDTSKRQLRPYVYIGEAKLTLPISRKSNVVLKIKNYGISPAVNVKSGKQNAIVARPIGE